LHPRRIASSGKLYEVGSAMSFLQVKNYTDEFEAALDGKGV
jgi:restriction system protein